MNESPPTYQGPSALHGVFQSETAGGGVVTLGFEYPRTEQADKAADVYQSQTLAAALPGLSLSLSLPLSLSLYIYIYI